MFIILYIFKSEKCLQGNKLKHTKMTNIGLKCSYYYSWAKINFTDDFTECNNNNKLIINKNK